MKRGILLGLIIAAIFGRFQPVLAQGMGEVCTSYDSFPSGWTVIAGSTETIGGYEAVRGVAGIGSVYGPAVGAVVKLDLPYIAQPYWINLLYYYTGDPDEYPGFLDVLAYRNNVGINDQRISLNPFPSWYSFNNSIMGGDADTLVVTIFHPSSGSHPDNIVALRVAQVCIIPSNPPTPTAQLYASATATYTASPTLTPTETITNTPITETPTPSLTPSDTTTPATPLPSMTATYWMTLDSGDFATVEPPEDKCQDITNPCPLLPVPNFPPLVLLSPTPIAVVALGVPSPVPSFTALAPNSGGQAELDFDLRPASTNIADLQESIDTSQELQIAGTPVDLANSLNATGSSIGGIFSFARAVMTIDLGPGGSVFLFLMLLIAINILIRLLLFLAPIGIAILRLILQLVQTLATAIRALIPL